MNRIEERFAWLFATLQESQLTTGTEDAFTAKCPLHPRSRKGELVATKLGDKIQLHCVKGCNPKEIAQSIGLEPHDLEDLAKPHQEENRGQKAAEKYLQAHNMPTFEPAGLPGAMQDYVGQCADVSGSDPILPTIALLSTLSSYAMHRIRLDHYFQAIHPNIWSLTLSASGSFKSTGLRIGTQILRDLDKEYVSFAKLAEEKEEETTQKYWLSHVRAMPESFSWQGLLDRMAEQGGGLFMLSEFSSFLHGINSKWNEGVKSRLTSIYDVVDPVEERTRGKATIRIEEPYLSICGVSTLEFIRDLITLEDIQSGFLTRFLLFYPPTDDRGVPAAAPPTSGDPNPRTWKSYQQLRKLCEELIEGKLRTGSMRNMGDAFELFEEHHKAIYSWIAEQESHLQPSLYVFCKRWSPTMLKLGLLMQLVIDPRQVEPSVKAIDAAWTILQYAMGSTKLMLETKFGVSPFQAKEQKLLQYLARNGGVMPWRKLIQSKTLPGGTKDYAYVLEGLEAKGLLVIKHPESQATKLVELLE